MLALPKDLMGTLIDLGVELRNIIEVTQDAAAVHSVTMPVMEQIEGLQELT